MSKHSPSGIFGRFVRQHHTKRPVAVRTRRLAFEGLELRRLLSVSAPTAIQFLPLTGQGTPTLTSANNSAATAAEELTFEVDGVTVGNTVKVFADGGTTAIATGTVQTGSTVQVTTTGNSPLGDGPHTFTAKQTDTSSNVSASSPGASVQVFSSLSVTVTSVRHSSATVGSAYTYTYTLQNNAVSGDTVTYSLPSSSAPTGMSYDAASQTVTWTPAADQEGATDSFTLSATDTAGNTVSALPVYVAVAAASGITVFAPPANVAVGSPVLVSFNDANAAASTYTVTAKSSNDSTGADLTGTVMPQQTNQVLKVITDQGEMDFQLLNNDAPNTVSHFVNLVNAGTYNASTYATLSGTFTLQVGSKTTAAIPFDSTNLAATATNIKTALQAAGFSGATVTIDSTTAAPNYVFDVTFSTAESPIAYQAGATAMPATFSNSASQSITAATQTLTFTETTPDFYRVIQSFMIQGGVGGTGSTIPVELNPDLRFTSSGLLAMANNGVDGNSSEFFVTNPNDMNNGFLNFRYTVFGKLIAGDDVRAAIASTPVTYNSSGTELSQPLTTPKIVSMSVTTETTSSVIMLKALSGATAGDTYTVTVHDNAGDTQTFTIHIGFTGQFTLASASGASTGQISFDSSNLTGTAANIQSALQAAGLSGATVSVDPASTATSMSFDVTFTTAESGITATTSDLPVAFSNSVSATATATSQVLTFSLTGTGSYDPPNPWVQPINGNDQITTVANTKATFTPVGGLDAAAGAVAPQIDVQLFRGVPTVPGALVDNSYTGTNPPASTTNADVTLAANIDGSYTVTPTNGDYGVQVLEVMGYTPVSGTFELQMGSGTGVPTTAAINFNSANLTTTANSILSALQGLNVGVENVTVDSASTAPNFIFNVKFASSQAEINYQAASTTLPIKFANSVTAAAASQQLTFTATGAAWDVTAGVDPVYRAFVPVYVAPPAPQITSISVGGKTVSGSTFANNVTAATALSFNVSGAVVGETLTVYMDGTTPVASGTVTSATVAAGHAITFTVASDGATRIADGNHQFTVQLATPSLGLYANWSNGNPGTRYQIPAGLFSSAVSGGVSLTIGLQALTIPVSKAQAGGLYTYVVQTNAPSGDTLTLNQSTWTRPQGMQFDGVNTFTWTPTTGQVSSTPYAFSAQFSDSLGHELTISADITVIIGLVPTQIPTSSKSGGNVTVLLSGSQVLVYDNLAHAVLSYTTFKPTDTVEIDAPAGQANDVLVLLPNSSAAPVPQKVLVQGTAGGTNNHVVVLGTGATNTFTVAGGLVTANGLATQIANVQSLELAGFGSSGYYKLSSSIAPLALINAGGYNTMDFSQDSGGVNVNLGLDKGQPQAIAPWNTTLSIFGVINKLIGSNYADVLTGGRAAMTEIVSGAGNDRIVGGSGDNILMGGGGNDTIIGSAGRNLLIGGSGNSTLYANGWENLAFGGTTNYDTSDQALLNLLNQGPRFMFSYIVRRALASAATSPTLLSSMFTFQDNGAHDTIFGSGSYNWLVAGKYGKVVG